MDAAVRFCIDIEPTDRGSENRFCPHRRTVGVI
jgi:hypothetical protein